MDDRHDAAWRRLLDLARQRRAQRAQGQPMSPAQTAAAWQALHEAVGTEMRTDTVLEPSKGAKTA